MHREVLLLTTLAAALAHPAPAAAAFDPVDALRMTTVVATTAGIDPENPFIDGTLSLRPSFKLTPNLSLGSRLDIIKEFTDDDGNDERHETVLTNVYLQVAHSKLATVGELVTLSGLARMYYPTSEASRLQGLTTAARIGGSVTVALAPATFMFSPFIQKNFHEYTMAVREDCSDGLQCPTGSQLSSWQAIYSFDLGFALPGGFSLDFNYAMANSHGYDNNVTPVSATGALGAADDEWVRSHDQADGRHQRFLHTATAALSYVLAADVSIEASIANGWMPQQRANGRDYFSPLIAYRNYGNSTGVGLSLIHVL